jgi:hypothetical protein
LLSFVLSAFRQNYLKHSYFKDGPGWGADHGSFVFSFISLSLPVPFFFVFYLSCFYIPVLLLPLSVLSLSVAVKQRYFICPVISCDEQGDQMSLEKIAQNVAQHIFRRNS